MGKSKNTAAGQIAYEADIQAMPTYHDGSPRKIWAELSEIAQWSWEMNPCSRDWATPGDEVESDYLDGHRSLEAWREENGAFGAGA